jgi:hypothetical protein
MPHKKCHQPPQNSLHLKFLFFYLYVNSNLRYKSGRLLVTVRVRHYGRGDVRSRV